MTACLLNDSPLDARQASMLGSRRPSIPTRARHNSADGSDPDGLVGMDALAERLGGAASLATSASELSLGDDAWSPTRSQRDMVSCCCCWSCSWGMNSEQGLGCPALQQGVPSVQCGELLLLLWCKLSARG